MKGEAQPFKQIMLQVELKAYFRRRNFALAHLTLHEISLERRIRGWFRWNNSADEMRMRLSG